MSLGAQFRQLNKQAAVFRKEVFGSDASGAPVAASYNRGEREIEIYYQFVKRRYFTQESGAIEKQGAILRWDKWDGTEAKKAYDFVPELQKQISFKDALDRELTFVIEEFFGAHVASVEWVLGCRLLL